MALRLSQAGARVAVTGRYETKNDEARRVLGADNMVLSADVTDKDSVVAAIASIVDRFGYLEVLVNNAGGFAGEWVTELTLPEWRSVIDSHLTGTFPCTKHAAARMRERGRAER